MVALPKIQRIFVHFGDPSSNHPQFGSGGLSDGDVLLHNGPAPLAGEISEYLKNVGVLCVEYLDNPGYIPAVVRFLETHRPNPLTHEWIVISNFDVLSWSELSPECIDDQCDIIGPVFSEGSAVWSPSAPSWPKIYAAMLDNCLCLLFGAWVRDVHAKLKKRRSETSAVMVHGACFAIRRTVLTELVQWLPPPRLYYEEWWLASGARLLGLEHSINSRWSVHHVGSSTLGERRPWRRRDYLRLCSLIKLARGGMVPISPRWLRSSRYGTAQSR